MSEGMETSKLGNRGSREGFHLLPLLRLPRFHSDSSTAAKDRNVLRRAPEYLRMVAVDSPDPSTEAMWPKLCVSSSFWRQYWMQW